VQIRPEAPGDHQAIRDVLDAAFPGEDVTLLVDLIRAADGFDPSLSLVADLDSRVIGHVLFSPMTLGGHTVLSLAPLGVHPDHHGKGVGTALTETGLAILADRDEPLVIVEGIPAYYPRFGFELASRYGIDKPSDHVPDEAFMVKWLGPVDDRYRGAVVYPQPFHDAGAIGP